MGAPAVVDGEGGGGRRRRRHTTKTMSTATSTTTTTRIHSQLEPLLDPGPATVRAVEACVEFP